MKVYVLEEGIYSDTSTLGVFSTLDNARNQCPSDIVWKSCSDAYGTAAWVATSGEKDPSGFGVWMPYKTYYDITEYEVDKG